MKKFFLFILIFISFNVFGYLYEETYKVNGIHEIKCNGGLCNSFEFGFGTKLGSGSTAIIELENYDSKTTCYLGICETKRETNLYGF